MCGRYTLRKPAAEVAARFDAETTFEFGERYNVAPSKEVPAVLATPQGRVLVPLKWGLVPHWERDRREARRPINARAEGLAQKPTVRDAFRKGRCLIPSDGFDEWRREGKSKRPFYIRRKDGGLFAFASSGAEWQQGGQAIRSCAIITTTPNALMPPIHDRMPVVLRPEDEEAWLRADAEEAHSLLRTYPDDEPEAFPVSTLVNSPMNDDPRCIEPSL